MISHTIPYHTHIYIKTEGNEILIYLSCPYHQEPEFLKTRDRMAGMLEPMSEFEKNPVRSQNSKVEENLRNAYNNTTYVLNVRNRAGLDDGA